MTTLLCLLIDCHISGQKAKQKAIQVLTFEIDRESVLVRGRGRYLQRLLLAALTRRVMVRLS